MTTKVCFVLLVVCSSVRAAGGLVVQYWNMGIVYIKYNSMYYYIYVVWLCMVYGLYVWCTYYMYSVVLCTRNITNIELHSDTSTIATHR